MPQIPAFDRGQIAAPPHDLIPGLTLDAATPPPVQAQALPPAKPWVDFTTDRKPFETPINAATQLYAQQSTTLRRALAASFEESSPIVWGARATERGSYAGSSWFDRSLALTGEALAGDAGMVVSPPIKTPLLSAEEANKRFAPEGFPITDVPITEGVARLLGKAKREELQRKDVLARFSGNAPWYTQVFVGAASFSLDPLNLSAGFLPGIGEEAILSRMTAAGLGRGIVTRTAARVGAGATAGLAFQAPLSAAHYGISAEESGDYDLRAAFKDMMFSAAFVAAAHAGFGALRDVVSPPPAAGVPPPGRGPGAAPAGAPPGAGRPPPRILTHADFAGGRDLEGMSFAFAMADARATMRREAQAALDSGGDVVLHVGGEDRRIVAVTKGGLKDSNGKEYGGSDVLKDKNAKLELRPGNNPLSGEAAKVLNASVDAKAAAARAATSQIVDGRPVDVTPVFDTVPPERPADIVDFVLSEGGVKPKGEGRDLVAQDLDKQLGRIGETGGRAFKVGQLRKLVQETGRSMDDMARAASDSGYLPGADPRGDAEALAEAIRETLSGNPHFSEHDRDAVTAWQEWEDAQRRPPEQYADDQERIYDEGYAPGIPQDEFDEARNATYGDHGEPPPEREPGEDDIDLDLLYGDRDAVAKAAKGEGAETVDVDGLFRRYLGEDAKPEDAALLDETGELQRAIDALDDVAATEEALMQAGECLTSGFGMAGEPAATEPPARLVRESVPPGEYDPSVTHQFAVKDRAGETQATILGRIDGDNFVVHDFEGRGANALGPAAIRDLARQLKTAIPELKTVSGLRLSGARGETDFGVDVPETKVRLPDSDEGTPF